MNLFPFPSVRMRVWEDRLEGIIPLLQVFYIIRMHECTHTFHMFSSRHGGSPCHVSFGPERQVLN